MKIAITRTRRPRDAYKVSDESAFPEAAMEVNLIAYRIKQDESGRWRVTFKRVPGFQRSKEITISPFWDTDVGDALLAWNLKNGGGRGLTVGCDFITDSQSDAMMIRMAFAS